MILYLILGVIVIICGYFLVLFVKDLVNHKESLSQEPGNPISMAVSQFIIYFFSTFGVSDFAIGASLYPKMKWVTSKNLPGTLNTACVIPVAAMALAYMTSIKVSIVTLLVAILCQVLGAYLTPKYVVKLPIKIIKLTVTAGLIVAALLILAGKLSLFPVGGTETGLTGVKLITLGVLSFIFGAFNNIGIGSYALTMATVYALGLSPDVAFPIMMGACAISVPVGSIQFIKLDSYSRKITLFSAIFGVLGVLVAVFVVKNLDVSQLLWVVILVIIYSAVSMIRSMKTEEV